MFIAYNKAFEHASKQQISMVDKHEFYFRLHLDWSLIKPDFQKQNLI